MLGKRVANSVGDVATRYDTLDARDGRSRLGLGPEVVNSGNLARVAAVDPLGELLDQGRDDVAEDVLDGLILDLSVLDSDGALEDADTLRVLVEDGLNIFSCPERILIDGQYD